MGQDDITALQISLLTDFLDQVIPFMDEDLQVQGGHIDTGVALTSGIQLHQFQPAAEIEVGFLHGIQQVPGLEKGLLWAHR